MENDRIDDPEYWAYLIESGGVDLSEMLAELGRVAKWASESVESLRKALEENERFVEWDELEVVGLGRYITVKPEEEEPLVD